MEQPAPGRHGRKLWFAVGFGAALALSVVLLLRDGNLALVAVWRMPSLSLLMTISTWNICLAMRCYNGHHDDLF